MSRSASTLDRTGMIFDRLEGSNCKAEMQLQRWTGSAWVVVEDLDEDTGIDWGAVSKPEKYASFDLVPPPPEVKFQVLNFNGKYSDQSGEAEAGVFDIDTKIKLRGGYIVEPAEAVLNTVDLSGGTFWHTENSSGIVLDSANAAAPTQFDDLNGSLLDSFLYDSANYACAGYWYLTIDLEGKNFQFIEEITVRANTTNGRAFWRFLAASAAGEVRNSSEDWQGGDTLTNGTLVMAVAENCDRFMQIAVVFDGTSWTGGEKVDLITYTSKQKIEWIYSEVFYLDTPEFTEPAAPEIPAVLCSGRGSMKRAFETEINLSDLSGGVSLDDLLKSICDRVGILYTATSIADLTSFGDRTLAGGLESVKSAAEIFDNIMQILNKSGSVKYSMFTEYDAATDDSVLFVQPRPSAYEANFVFDYRNYEGIGSRKKNRDRLLQRLSVFNKKGFPDKEELLAYDTYTVNGDYTLSWSGDAYFKRITVSGTGTISLRGNRVDKEQIEITVSGVSGFVFVSVYGCKWGSSAPTFQAEDIHMPNQITGSGFTAQIENPLIESDAEAKAIAQGFTEEFGVPIYEANQIRWAYLNLLLEINDMVMLWSRFLFQTNLYYITGISHHWDRSENTGEYTSFNIADSGLDFADQGSIIYDRDETLNGTLIKYDTGFLYDMIAGVQGKDSDIPESLFGSNTGEA